MLSLLRAAVSGAGILLIAPTSAFAVAGGATGSGGGGGGGGFSGGGSSGSGGSDCTSTACDVIGIAIGGVVVLIVIFAVIAGLVYRAKRKARTLRVEQEARRADAGDGYWDPRRLEERVKQCFFPIQLSWENRDIEASRPYVSDSLYERHKLQLEGYEAQNRCNRIADLKLNAIRLVRIHNVTDDGEDRFVAEIKCQARDWMEDTETGAFVNGNKETPTHFTQYWSFARHPDYGWVLDEIQQGEEAKYHETAELVNTDEGPLAEPVIDDAAPVPAAGAAVSAPDPDDRVSATVAAADAPVATAAWHGSNGSSNGAGHPANWYADPSGAHKWRWWDGSNWTAHTAD